jgi:hypothetical protein
MINAPNTVARTKLVVADDYGITVGELLTGTKRYAAAHPRQLAIWLCRTCVAGGSGRPISLSTLARLFHLQDHSTPWHALHAVERRIAASSEFADRVRVLRYRIACEVFRTRSLADASERFPALAAGPAKPRTCQIFVIRRMNSTANGSALSVRPSAPRTGIVQGAHQYSGAM